MPTQEEVDKQAAMNKLLKAMFRGRWNRYEERFTTFTAADIVNTIKAGQPFAQYQRAATNLAIDAERVLPPENPVDFDKGYEGRASCLKRICQEQAFYVSWTTDGRLKNESSNPLQFAIVADHRTSGFGEIIVSAGASTPIIPAIAKAVRIAVDGGGLPRDPASWPTIAHDPVSRWFREDVIFPDATPLILL